jgi:glycerol-3-phosphate dehydrogenase (NAD+)
MSDRQPKIAQIEELKKQIATLQSELAAAPAGAAGSQGKKRVCLLGSGNWGSAVAKILGTNAAKYDTFETEVRMWVYEEEVEVDGEKRKLTEVINQRHENVKYLPGISLPENIIAEPDVKKAAEGAHILVWVLPHQFVGRTAAGIKDVVAEGCVSCSLVKGGIDIKPEGMELCSEVIFKEFNHPVSVLMGANLANEVALGQFAEATLGSTDATGPILQTLFDTPTFRVRQVQAVEAVELCGAVKNIVALAAGFVDGLDMGNNTKAAVMRIGLQETETFIQHFFPAQSTPLLESCGVADLVTTCFGGRNRKCAEAFARAGGKRKWEEIEAELLNGQKLQGPMTSAELMPVIKANKLEKKLPLLCAVHAISFEGATLQSLFDALGGTAA